MTAKAEGSLLRRLREAPGEGGGDLLGLTGEETLAIDSTETIGERERKMNAWRHLKAENLCKSYKDKEVLQQSGSDHRVREDLRPHSPERGGKTHRLLASHRPETPKTAARSPTIQRPAGVGEAQKALNDICFSPGAPATPGSFRHRNNL